jgi:hypothetical protein
MLSRGDVGERIAHGSMRATKRRLLPLPRPEPLPASVMLRAVGLHAP